MNRRVCIIAPELLGPIRAGGIASAASSLAELLLESGYDVTILYPRNRSDAQPVEFWIRQYEKKGIRLESLFAEETGKQLAYLTYHWVKEHADFETIHYYDWGGIGFWTAAAKRQGLAFKDTTLVCHLRKQALWDLERSAEFLSEVWQLEIDYMERRGAELADVVVSPSQYMVDYLIDRRWRLPRRLFIAPPLLPSDFTAKFASGNTTAVQHPIDEIVFFGRLDAGKGLDFFCEALNTIGDAGERKLSITFLGRHAHVGGQGSAEYIIQSSAEWNAPYRILADRDRDAAIRYLSRAGRLAIIPSPTDNAPTAVLECLAAQIPFLAANVGGIGELIAPEDRARVLFDRDPNAFRERLLAALDEGIAPARSARATNESRTSWRDWHAGLAGSAVFAPAIIDAAPLVSVCLSTFDRPALCSLALNSLEHQTYKRIEVVLIDDASPSQKARDFLADIKPDFDRRGWRIIRNDAEQWTGKARNTAVANASGKYVLLMDDDNVAMPHEVETFVTAASASDADILTCQQQRFAGDSSPPPFEAEIPVGFMPVGPNLSQALYENCIGDLNMMVRRDAWEELGGFTEERCGCEDYEFLVRAALAGYHIECLPEILFFYRISRNALAQRYKPRAIHDSFQRALRPFLAAIPPALQGGVKLAVTSRRHAERQAEHGYWGKI